MYGTGTSRMADVAYSVDLRSSIGRTNSTSSAALHTP